MKARCLNATPSDPVIRMTLTEPSFANPSSQPAPERERLGEMLVKAGKLSARDLERALSAQQELGNLLGQVLIQLGVVSELDVAHTLARQLNIPFIAADFSYHIIKTGTPLFGNPVYILIYSIILSQRPPSFLLQVYPARR